MSTSRIVAFRDAFATALAAQLTTDGTTGVTTLKYPKVDPDREDTIILTDADASQQHHTLGGSRIETFTLNGEVLVWKDGGSQDEASEAETRALLVYASVENLLRGTPTVGSIFHAQASSYRSEVQIDERGYIGHVEFTVEVEAHI